MHGLRARGSSAGDSVRVGVVVIRIGVGLIVIRIRVGLIVIRIWIRVVVIQIWIGLRGEAMSAPLGLVRVQGSRLEVGGLVGVESSLRRGKGALRRALRGVECWLKEIARLGSRAGSWHH